MRLSSPHKRATPPSEDAPHHVGSKASTFEGSQMLDIDDIYDELDFINQAAVSEQIEASATALSS